MVGGVERNGSPHHARDGDNAPRDAHPSGDVSFGRARQRHRSGSTHHDCSLPIPTPRCWSFLSLPITPARDCSPNYRARPSDKCFQLHTSICKPILSNPPSAYTSLKLQFSLCVPSHQCGPLSAQIPIAEHAARRGPARVPNARFPPLEVFVRRPPEYVALSVGGRHPKTFT
jgi:hypothetical protein